MEYEISYHGIDDVNEEGVPYYKQWGYDFEDKEKVGIHCCDNHVPETCPKVKKIKCSWIGCDNSVSEKWVQFQGGLIYIGWATFMLYGKRFYLCPKHNKKLHEEVIKPNLIGEEIDGIEG